MNVVSKVRSALTGRPARLMATVATVAAVVFIVGTVDVDALGRAASQAQQEPEWVAIAVASFAAAFALRAIAWRLVVPRLPFGHALSAIHVTLGANHVLPFRLGEPLRVLSITKRAGIAVDTATASVVTLRAADILAVIGLGIVVAPSAFVQLVGPFGWLVVAAIAVVAVYGWRWLASVAKRRGDVRLPGPVAFALSIAAWGAEAVVVWQAARWAGLEITGTQAVLVTTVAVAAQVAAIAPGGFGTYEAAAVAAYVSLGYDADAALVAALGAHALKTAYSLVAGGIALIAPTPGLLGRLRLAAVPKRSPEPIIQNVEDGPVLLFMPAFNEEASITSCLRRVPEKVLGRPVDVLVIDDGSTDRTADRARAAGADVMSLDRNQGLGAAVRIGLAEGVSRGAAAIAFCDADGEYPPEELVNLVGPILDQEADYVVGSRFLGRIDHMRPHRRLGNITLTKLLSAVARRRISDGQSGYRAFSPRAAAHAEVIHDFNYAQVLTLDLLAKGYRYHEVAISYHFRTEGESFIKLGSYLRNVIPAVYRELNADRDTYGNNHQPA